MRYRRAYMGGATYFFTINLLDRNSTLLTDNISLLRQAIYATKKSHPFHMNGIVVLPEHMHLVIELPENDSDFSFRIGKIKSLFSRAIPIQEPINDSRYTKRERGIWQRRFWEHWIRDDADLEHHMNYIHYNPVKHGYVERASDWAYSSIHKYIKNGSILNDWAYDATPAHLSFGE